MATQVNLPIQAIVQEDGSKFLLNGHEVEVFGSYSEPWFVGIRVAEILEYVDPGRAVRSHVDDANKRIESVDKRWGGESPPHLLGKNGVRHTQAYVLINESGLYELILGSTLQSAKKFKKWVFEVLKSIRLTGSYKLDRELNTLQIENSKLQEEKVAIQESRINTSGFNSERMNLWNDIQCEIKLTSIGLFSVGQLVDLLYPNRYRRGFKQRVGSIVRRQIEPFKHNQIDEYQLSGGSAVVCKAFIYEFPFVYRINEIIHFLFPEFDILAKQTCKKCFVEVFKKDWKQHFKHCSALSELMFNLKQENENLKKEIANLRTMLEESLKRI